MRRAVFVLVGVLTAVAVAGCSSSGGRGARSVSPSTPVSVSVPASVSSGPVSSGPASSGAAPSVSASGSTPGSASVPPSTPVSPSAPSSAPASSSTPPQPKSTCTSLSIRVIRGGAAINLQFAALQFTNTGSSTCVLNGYPVVTLLRDGKPVGRISQPAGAALSSRRLAPGATAESRLNDYVANCNADIVYTARVVAPGSSITVTRPVVLRACALRTSALGAPE